MSPTDTVPTCGKPAHIVHELYRPSLHLIQSFSRVLSAWRNSSSPRPISLRMWTRRTRRDRWSSTRSLMRSSRTHPRSLESCFGESSGNLGTMSIKRLSQKRCLSSRPPNLGKQSRSHGKIHAIPQTRGQSTLIHCKPSRSQCRGS